MLICLKITAIIGPDPAQRATLEANQSNNMDDKYAEITKKNKTLNNVASDGKKVRHDRA